ncbi:hypothetical protein U472_08245 [Orenia metallireducens]|uniref:Immunity protein 30 domain-containing protein n=1 Tax=Orenia metallireducens TaxID=1413210 RepID=A0A1C0A6X9_9FIRM|nr:Imm30 family immunity protein [Orenia metallireducens]OCL26007.1 hypothetical protein U472_08245 [Orenia metallireducens]
MNISEITEKLKRNKLLRNKKEINGFEEALMELNEINNVKIIGDLCKGFDDNTKEYEIMYNVLHAVEDYEGEGAYIELLKITPYMIENDAKEWSKRLHRRILNHSQERIEYIKALKKMDTSIQNIIIKLIHDINNDGKKWLNNEEQKKFENITNEVLNELR